MRLPAYPSYKDSGVSWLGHIPEQWDVSRIKFIVSTPVTDGPHETPEILSEGIPFVSAEAIVNGRIDFDKIRGYISEEDHRRFCKKYCPRLGDIYMVKSGATTGRVAMVEDDRVFNIWSPLAAIRCNKYLADLRFIYHYMHSREFQTAVQLSWSYGTQQNIGMGVIQNLSVPLPSIPEQRIVADFLDIWTAKINSLLAKKRELIEKLKEKRSAVISSTVTRGLPPEVARAAGLDPQPDMKASGIDWLGEVPNHWDLKAIKWETPVLRGASPRPIDDPIYFDDDNGEHAWVRISDVTASGMYLEVTEQKLSTIGSSLSVKLDPGALFLSIAGSVGKPCITKIKCCIHDGFVYFPRFKGETRFLYYIFASGEPYKGLGKMGTQLNLNTDTVGSIVIGIPDFTEQVAIADFLDYETARLDRMVAKVEEAIERLQEYRIALITSAVTGKIDVRGAVA